MGIKLIEFRAEPDGVLTNVTSVVFRDPTATFGMKRTDTDAIVIAAGTPLVNTATGIYRYQFTEPAADLSYEYWIEIVYAGRTYRQKQTLQTASQASGFGLLSNFVSNGIALLACGDTDLEEFLTTYAATIWALTARRGVALDLRYNYFVLDLDTLALDHVRMMIDTFSDDSQSQELGYFNSMSESDAIMNSSRTASSSSVQSASSLQSFSRSALRTSSSSMEASASQTSSRTGTGTDTSTQLQTSDTNRRSTNEQLTTTTPFMHRTIDGFKDAHMTSRVDTYDSEITDRYVINAPFVGTFTGTEGGRQTPEGSNQSSRSGYDANSSEAHSTQRTTVIGDGEAVDDLTVEGDGERTNAIHRSTVSVMSGASTMTSQSAMSSTAHSESHRESQSTFHSESASHAEMAASSVSHSEAQGASNSTNTGLANHQYYSQIFESLKQIYDDTLEQIKQLEQQVMLTNRYLVSKMPVVTVQNSRLRDIAARTVLGLNPSRTIIIR